MRFRIKYGIFAVLFLLLSLHFETDALATDLTVMEYAETLIQKARQMELYRDPYWLLLLHYKRGVVGNRSLVDDAGFFLSPEGKRDPRAEMEATLQAFFRKPAEGQIAAGFKFIARLDWLSKKLDIDKSRLPDDYLKRFDDFYSSLDPANVILVFPAGYVDSPASMFGHTLLVLEKSGENRLVAQAVNYAAKTTDTFGPTFAFKGVFGIYRGYYSFMPYFEKITEYSDGEMRDMWEYRLNLSEEEKRRLVMHMVEMEDIGSRYFFFDENCSYNLLFLLDAARPSARLTDRFRVTVEPIDTIRAVIDANMVRERIYRASLYGKIMNRTVQMNPRLQRESLDISQGMKSPGGDTDSRSSREKALVYDLAINYLQFAAAKGTITKQEYSSRFLSVLNARSLLDFSGDTVINDAPPPPPEASHFSNKATVSYGFDRPYHFAQITYRPSCNEIIDVDRGLTPNSQIVFGNTSVRYYPQRNRVRLERFDVVDVVSLPPSHSFFINNCWKLQFGCEQMRVPDGGENLSGYVHMGGGLSVLAGMAGQLYGMIDVDLNMAGPYTYYVMNGYAARLGLVSRYGDRWKSHVFARAGYVPWGDRSFLWEARIDQRLMITINSSLSAGYRVIHVFDKTRDEILVSGSIFF